MTILEAADLLGQRRVSATELTPRRYRSYREVLQPALNAFLTVTAESALTRARDGRLPIGNWRGQRATDRRDFVCTEFRLR